MLESKRRAIIFLILAFLLAVVAGFVFLQKVKAINSELGGMTDVFVASKEVYSRALITPDDVTIMSIPNRFVTDSHIVDYQDLQNQVSIVPLSKGDLITKNMLKDYAQLQDEEHRLVTVMAGENVVFDQQLEAMDRVDIIVSENFEGKPNTSLFMKDVLVARVASSGGEFKGVQLEMSIEQAQPFIHRQNYADQIRLLKSNIGRDQVEDDGVEEALEEDEEQATKEENKPKKEEAKPENNAKSEQE
ncbi:Flp pilus assembly protein CpaB [Halalkalibacter urbisdiaboli]|uniref:Flp pilus assembly protein CpaB n=1 Tax=Halalkalibacter urbisdiaboli TaxID=1960589 RepID=UPI001055D58C|nr:SAF domain-containing protein [Halalkalibacter urbisdiaboli]